MKRRIIVFSSVAVLLLFLIYLFFVWKEHRNKSIVEKFLTELQEGNFQEAITLTEDKAKEVMEHLFENFEKDLLKYVFSNIHVKSITDYELPEVIEKAYRSSKPYLVVYELKIDKEKFNIKEDLSNCKVVFFVKGTKIVNMLDLKCNIFMIQ